MSGQQIGYVRVSTIDQNTDRQLEGIQLNRIFTEKASAKDAKRPQLQECMAYLREGDTLHVHSIDRLARNLQDLLWVLDELTGRGVAVHFHKEHLIFTGEDNPFQKLQLQIIGAVAEFERAILKERQKEGIRAAQKAGKQMGRAKVLSSAQIAEIKSRLATGETKKALAKEYQVSRQTIYTALRC